MVLKIFYLNVDNYAAAQLLLLRHMINVNCDLTIICENIYSYYLNNRVAIIVKISLTHKIISISNNIIAIQLGNNLLIGFYFTFNQEREPPLRTIDILLKNNPLNMLLCLHSTSSSLDRCFR